MNTDEARETAEAFFRAWVDDDFEGALEHAQLSWQLHHEHEQGHVELPWRLVEMTQGFGGVVDAEQVSPCMVDVTVALEVIDDIDQDPETEHHTVRVVAESGPYEPDPDGEPGVSVWSLTG